VTAAIPAATANTDPNLREVSTMDSVSRSTSEVACDLTRRR
jgi:hypothetical protein